jgi:hypothetical protein
MDNLVPGPIKAWRIWYLRDASSPLQSLHQSEDVWVPGEAFGFRCKQHTGMWLWRRAAHPGEGLGYDCICGIYACNSPVLVYDYYLEWLEHIAWKHKVRCRHHLVERYGTSRPRVIIGKVSLWGDVLETGHLFGPVLGYRASQAYPDRLWVPINEWEGDSSDVAQALQASYRVPVHTIAHPSYIIWADEERASIDVPIDY